MDNRIIFPAPPVDFTIVGTTGQDHDNYPSPDQQPRYDWMRSFLIGLLSCQSSTSEPTQFRDGTLWFDLNTSMMKVRSNGRWVPLAETISVGDDNFGNPITIAGLFTTIQTLLGNTPTATFSGNSTHSNVTQIPIPTAIQPAAAVGSNILLWVNGTLVDPRLLSLIGTPSPTTIILPSGSTLQQGDVFTVLFLNIVTQFFYPTSVVV